MFNLYQHVLVRLPTAPAETKPLLLEDNLAHWAQQQDNKGHAWNMPGTKPIGPILLTGAASWFLFRLCCHADGQIHRAGRT